MRYGHTVNRELGVNFGGDLTHLGEGHGFVGFVVQVESAAAVRLVAYASIEGDDGAVRTGADMANERVGVDALMNKQDQVAAGRRGHQFSLAAAYWRKEGDFVAGIEGRTPGGEFPIARGYQ